MQAKLNATMKQLANLRDTEDVAAAGGSSSPRKSRPSQRVAGKPRAGRSKSKSRTAGDGGSGVDKSRKGSYRFGNAKVNFIKPSEGYPSARDALDKPSGGLILEYAHGYQGRENYGRGNMFYVSDEKTQEGALVYHVAGVGVVLNCKERTQNFFTGHNDDITCIAVSAHPDRPTLVATGQTDPKDYGEKDMPKIFIWDWVTMKKVKLIPDAHWGMVMK